VPDSKAAEADCRLGFTEVRSRYKAAATGWLRVREDMLQVPLRHAQGTNMEYAIGTANGDAGEFFVAYKIAKELGWPCRLFDIDIGIDAQIEILTTDRMSSGRFVALQVKSTSVKETDARYVSGRKLTYWRSLEIPVFVVLVDLRSEQIYLHLIEADHEYEQTRTGRYIVRFDLEADRFTPEGAAKRFAEASERRVMNHIKEWLHEVDEAVDEMFSDMDDLSRGNPNPDALIEDMNRRNELLALLDQADAAASLGNVGVAAVAERREKLLWALNDLQEAMYPMRVDYADKADIAGFLEEEYPTRPDDEPELS
jgi:hypothetical protein